MKRLGNVATEKTELELIECDCGFHLGIDATYLEQVGTVSIVCPACGLRIDTDDDSIFTIGQDIS